VSAGDVLTSCRLAADGTPTLCPMHMYLLNVVNDQWPVPRLPGMQRGAPWLPGTIQHRRDKRWQYSDAVQLCIRSRCHDRWGVQFYHCAFERCVSF